MNHPRLFAFLTFIFHFYIIPLELEAFVLDIHNPDRMIPVFTSLGKISLRISNKVKVLSTADFIFNYFFSKIGETNNRLRHDDLLRWTGGIILQSPFFLTY